MTRADMSGSFVEPLLPGETRQSDMLEDAEHWVAVYGELISVLVDIPEGDGDRLGIFRRRLAYWRHRRDELAR